MNRIAVLMTCYNRVDTTLECLRRLFAQEVPEGYTFDVWLVDDASPDKTGEKVKAAYPQVNVIQGTGKLFWCKGMRLAWDKAAEACDYDFYLWLNDDTMLYDGALGTVIKDWEYAITCKDGVICGQFTDGPDSNDICYGLNLTINSPNIVPNGKWPIEGRGYICGNLLLVPKSTFRKVGPICKYYHHGYGDYDYGIQVQKNGFVTYASSRVLGWCRAHHGAYQDLKNMPLVKRLALLVTPNGYHLGDATLYRYRSHGVLRAIVSFFHILFKVVFAL